MHVIKPGFEIVPIRLSETCQNISEQDKCPYIGLYRDVWIAAIQNESRDPFGGNVYYVTMQITFLTRKFRNGERNLHCDAVQITTKWVSSLTLDCNGVFAIKAYGYPADKSIFYCNLKLGLLKLQEETAGTS